MSEFSRGPSRGRNFHVTNRGSDSEDSGADDSPERYQPPPSEYYISRTPHRRHPLPNPPGPLPPTPAPLTTNNLTPRIPRYKSSHPSLSSPSSASSPAAEESTPPPTTPALPVPPVDLTAEPTTVHEVPSVDSFTPNRPERVDITPLQTSRVGKFIQSLKVYKPNYPRPSTGSPTKRPSTSPTASTPESYSYSYTSSSTHSPSTSSGDRTLILVTTDSDKYVNVDITGATTATFIRECVFNKLNIFAEDERAHYSIFQTEVDNTIIGKNLSDERLLELCRQHGDARGSLKLLVSHTQAPVHDASILPQPTLMSPVNPQGLLSPVSFPSYSSPPPLQPQRSVSRQGSISSASERETSTGYEADLDNPERESHRTTIRPGQLHGALSTDANTSKHPPSPHMQPSRPPSPPTLHSSMSVPIGTEKTTIYDRYGNILPPPPPPPPLSPHRATFSLEDINLTPPANGKTHVRTSSENGLDSHDRTRDRNNEHSSRQRRNEISPVAGRMKIDPLKERNRPRPKGVRDSDDNLGRSDSWVMISRSKDGSRVSEESLPQSVGRDSPSSRKQPSAAKYKVTSPHGHPIPIPAPPRNPPPAVPSSSSDSRSFSRPPGQAVPPNWVISWTGERSGSGKSKVLPSTPSYGSRLAVSKSVDNLRLTTARNQPTSTPSTSLKRNPGQPSIRQNSSKDFLSTAYREAGASSSGLPKSYESPRPHIRPLPKHGGSHPLPIDPSRNPSSNSVQTSYSSGTLSPPDRPRSALDETLSNTSTLVNSSMGGMLNGHGPRPISPVRPSRQLNRPIDVPHSGRESSPRSPTSPTSPRHTAERPDLDVSQTYSKEAEDRYSWIHETSEGRNSESTVIPLKPSALPKYAPAAIDFAHSNRHISSDYSSGDDDVGTSTSLWNIPPTSPDSSNQFNQHRPELTLTIENSDGVCPISIPSADSGKNPTVPASVPHASQSTRSPSDSKSAATPYSSKKRVRGSTFDERDSSWAPRPPPEDMYDRLEEFFPEHDLDKPLIESGSGGTSPTSAEPIPPPPPVPVSDKSFDRFRMKGKKSIRVVAEEHKKRIDRTSRIDSSFSTNVLRKRSTKLWGSKLEEVTTGPAKSNVGTIGGPESPSSAPTTFKWVRGELIGRGTYGRVYLALNATTGEMMAVKQVEIPRTASDKNDSRQVTVVEALKLESETLKDLDHPNIVSYLGFEETPMNLSIFLEYVPGGSIGSCLQKHGKFDEEVTKSFTSQILNGLEYLHSKGILHRDLKADNILVEVTGVCKIGDFGISKRTADLTGGEAVTAMQGTVFWMAPEVVNPQGKGYNFKVDVWSVGCVVLEMWAGMRPWQGDEAVAVMFKLYSSQLPPPVPDDVHLSELAEDFRAKCFARNPDDRPSAAQLRRHKYLELNPGWSFTGFK